jgi:glycosyltransferase involved in cell wall biosynthesis
MRVIFDLRETGLGNNGGSLTLIKSANTLQELGHEVFIVDSMKSMTTWVSLNVPHIIYKGKKDLPDADAIVATGYKSWRNTLVSPNWCGKKFIWVRGWEIWNAPENQLISILSDEGIIKIVNGYGIQKRLKKYNIDSFLVRPGNDLQDFYPMNIRDKNKIVLGGLYHTRHKTKRSDWIISVTNQLKKKYNNIELYMLGANKSINNADINRYFSQPTIEQKNYMFNKVDIFLAPSSLEGLHIVPQEAMLTECPVVGTNAELAGLDYLLHMYNGLISLDNFKDFSKVVELLIIDKGLRLALGKNARKTIIEWGDRKQNMQKFIDVIMERIS